MGERFIKLCNVSNCIALHEYQSITISADVKYVCIQLLNNKAVLYCLSRNNEYTEGPIWESSDVRSCIFSDEGNEFMVVSNDNCCRIYRLLEASVVLIREVSLEELSIIIGEFDIELTCESDVKLQKFNKKTVIVFVNNVWLVILKWGSEEVLLAQNKIEVASCVTIDMGINAIYTLTAGGNVSAYDQNDGGQLGVVHIYAMVPPSRVMDVLSFKYLSVNLDGTSLAVSDRASQVFLIKVKNAFAMDDVSEHQNSRWDCGTSVRSFGSDVSRLTSASRIQPKVLADTVSLSSSVMQDAGGSTSYKVTWNSYLQSLQKSSHGGTSVNQYSCMQKVSDPPAGLTVRGLQLGNGELSVWFTEPDAQSGGIYYLHDLVNNTCIEQPLSDDTVVIPGGLVGLKDAFLSPRGLFMFLGALSHDVLVSKMLHCMQRESLGRLLQGETWTNLMVPLPAVVVALKQQQLDVVQLALSLHVHGLKSTFLNVAEYEEEGWKDKLRKLMGDLEELLLVIQQACIEYAQKPALREQLIASTLEQTNRLLECLCAKKFTLALEFSQQIMLHVVQLRKHLLGQSIASEQRKIECEDAGCPKLLTGEWQKWKNMSDEAVIQDAIMQNCVPLSQVFFIEVRSWPKSSIHSRYHKHVDNWVSSLLEESDFEKAEKILWIVGKDPNETLLRICVETEHHKLRDRLAVHLSEKGLFPSVEMDALNFLKQVEEILDVIDFSSLGTRGDATDKVFLNIHLNEDKIPLCAVLEKSDEWRQFVLISLFFNVPGAGHLESMLQCEFVWLYLLENNREDLLCTWITCALSESSWETIPLCVEEWSERLKAIPVVTAAECRYISAESLMNIFKRWFITENMVNSVSSANAMTTIKEIVLNHLSRFGVFSINEKADVRAILKRAIFTGNVDNLENLLNQKSGNVTYTEFQILLTKHLINNDLYDIAFPCLEDFEYSDELLENLHNADQDHGDWLPLWLAFRDMKKKPGDNAVIYNVILKNAQYLSKGDLKGYLKDHPIVVLALLVYEGRSLGEIFTSNEDISNVDLDTLSATLNHYSLLERAVTSFTNPSEETPDITLYQLLEGNAPFDVSKLFGWQRSHRIEGEEFPHFTCPKLVEKYGIEYKMTYLMYLKLARPCFAACRFVIDQYKTHATLSHKRIKDAVNAAHGLALQNFDDEEITASCLSFTEILGEDSCKLKVDLCSVRKIFDYLQSGEEDNENIEHIGEMLYEMRQHNSEAASKLLHFLERALQKEIAHCKQMGKKSVEEIAQWGLAVKFARSHGLKLPEVFLRQLASENNLFVFMMFIEIYRYPLHQVKDLSKSFCSLILQEHLFHILQVEVVTESKEDSIHLVPRDARKSLYSKILPKKQKLKQEDALPLGKPKKITKRRRETDHPDQQKGATDKMMDLAASLSSGSSGEEVIGSNLISYDVWRVDDDIDLFLVLLKCHNAQDPLRALLHETYALQNPVLAVLATCYDVEMVIPCFCAWMIVSLPHVNSERLLNELGKSSYDLVWTENEVLRILEEAVSCRFIRTLRHGCWIFFPDSPLGDLMDFLYEAIIMKDFEECLLRMKSFKAAFLNLKNNDQNQTLDFIGNGLWLGHVAVQLTKAAMSFALTSLQFVLEFLAVIREGNFLDHLPEPLPDFELVERLLKCLSLTGVFPNMSALLYPAGSSEHQNEVNRCLQELSQSKQFSCALQLASASGLSRDPVLMAQWSDKFEQSSKRPLGRGFLGFWKKCDDTFHSEKVYPHTAAKFFQHHAEKLTDLEEKFLVLQLAVRWLQEAVLKITDASDVDFKNEMASVELNMWNCWLQAPYELPLSTESTNPEMLYSTKNVILEQAGVSDLIISPKIISDEEKQKVLALLGKLLDMGNMISACRVEAMYGVKHQDLHILLLCLGLAEGTVSPYELTAEQRLLFSEVSNTRTLSHRRRALLSSISTLSHSPGTNSLLVDYVEIPPRDRQDTLTALEKLTGRLEHGIAIGNRVVMCYRVAMNLDLNYLDVLVLREPLNLLKTALADDCLNKFIVASDIITAAQINSTEVAEFMAREILEAVTKSKLKGEVSGTTMWGIELESCFHLVLDVCKDQAALGNKLLSLASQATSRRVHSFHDAHVIAVELVIHAHNCFVAALNMEGIGSVLQTCQTITNRLLKKEEWGLMVRLLTGVERYTEMNYIFKILYDHEQFEFLLAKGLDKVKGLKVAVIDFLKKRCPGDRKLYEMVTLRFGMFQEVAVLWESDGLAEEEAVLPLILKDQNDANYSLLPHNEVVKKHLTNAMDCFKHAAEFFIKGEMLIRATHLVYHAELVALQRYFISTVFPGQGAPLLLHLSSEEVTNLVTNVLTFPQAYLVVQAYDHPVDWAAALYQHCVLKGDESYFTAFTTSIPLTSSMVEDIVRRFQVQRNITADNARMMKMFIEQVDSLELKYRLASQLGLRDLIESLLNGPEDDVAYLKDTVWQHGFRS